MDKRQSNPIRGILLKISSVIVFLAMSTCIKLAGDDLTTGEITFYRSFFAIVPIFAYLGWRGELKTAFRTQSVMGQITRGFVGILSMTCSFYGLVRLPLPDAIAIGYAMPLISVIFASVFLKERVHVYRWTAVAVGLGGVAVISWPRLTLFSAGAPPVATLGVLALITSATLGAVAMILVRRLVRTEQSPTIVLYFSLTASAFSLASLPFGWTPMTPEQRLLLITAGFCGGVAQILMTEAYRFADVSTIAPFEYVSIVFGLIVSYFLFADVPEPLMLIGTAIVMAAGIFIIFRERRLGVERKALARLAAPPG